MVCPSVRLPTGLTAAVQISVPETRKYLGVSSYPSGGGPIPDSVGATGGKDES